MIKKRIVTKKILDIDEDMSIYAESNQYVVHGPGAKRSYFGYLEACFQDIFEEKVKSNLFKSNKEGMQEILKIHKEVASDLKKIFRKTEGPFKD